MKAKFTESQTECLGDSERKKTESLLCWMSGGFIEDYGLVDVSSQVSSISQLLPGPRSLGIEMSGNGGLEYMRTSRSHSSNVICCAGRLQKSQSLTPRPLGGGRSYL